MDRRTIGFVAATLLSVATTSAVSAQTPPAPAPAPVPGNPKLEGTWEGSYLTDGPSGAMTVTVKSGTQWVVTNALTGDAPVPAEPRDVVADGDKITWKQLFGEYDVVFKATLSADGGQLTGILEAYQGGSYAAGGSFTLARGKQ
jgi:hypothetical protein